MADETDNARLGPYRLIRRIARGGMGEVWLAQSDEKSGLQKQVALKTVLAHVSDDPTFIERFRDEARIASTLSHGNIVPVFAFGQDQGQYFLAMEYIDGWDLRTLLRRIRAKHERFPEELALYIAAEVCRGLDYAHHRKDVDGEFSPIIHRDISPGNILLSRDGEVRIVDFGIASARDKLSTTLTGQLRGKIAYMSPEQASGEPAHAASDLFSLGVVLYEMLAGVRPFEGDTDLEVLKQVQTGAHRSLRDVRADLCEETHVLVERALALHPADRFDSASAMQMALLEGLYQHTGPVSARRLATFCLRYDRPRYESGVRPNQSFDDLLAQQISDMDTGAEHTPGDRTPPVGAAPRPDAIAAQVEAEAPARTETILLAPVGTRRRRNLRIAIAIVALLIVIVSMLSFRLGSRSGAQAPVIRVHTDPDNALIYFDGVAYGRSTLVARPAPGDWLVRAELEGHRSAERMVHFDGKEDLSLRFTLPALPASKEASKKQPSARTEDSKSTADEPVAPLRDATNTPLSAPAAPISARSQQDTHNSVAKKPATSDQTPQVRYMRIAVHGLPAGASVSINGHVAADPGSLRLPIGKRVRIEAKASGFLPATTHYTAEAGRTVLNIALTPVPTGQLTVRFIGTILIGEVIVDGTSYGHNESAPRKEIALPVGSHSVTVRNRKLDRSFQQDITVRKDAETTVRVDWK